MVIDDLSKKLDEVEEAFYVIAEMKKAADLADAKEEQSDSTSSGDAMPVHPKGTASFDLHQRSSHCVLLRRLTRQARHTSAED